MTALLDAVASVGARLGAASGSRISFDARRALSRHDDLTLLHADLWSANRQSRLVACSDGWIAVSLARASDHDLVPAWTGADFGGDSWEAVIGHAVERSAVSMVETGVALHLPVARVGEARQLTPPALEQGAPATGRVIDLSALWAGPYCGGLLAEAGLEVLKIDSPLRPDPTRRHTPHLDARLNGRKQRLSLELDSAEMRGLIAKARVLITSARPHALARLGIDETSLFAANPTLLWIAITAHGWRGSGAMRVGFGDDCAAAGGLVLWDRERPAFMGDALADPLTGLTAATLALETLAEGSSGLIDVPLSGVAAGFAEALA